MIKFKVCNKTTYRQNLSTYGELNVILENGTQFAIKGNLQISIQRFFIKNNTLKMKHGRAPYKMLLHLIYI